VLIQTEYYLIISQILRVDMKLPQIRVTALSLMRLSGLGEWIRKVICMLPRLLIVRRVCRHFVNISPDLLPPTVLYLLRPNRLWNSVGSGLFHAMRLEPMKRIMTVLMIRIVMLKPNSPDIPF